jgi:hypothetical protein
MSVLIVVSNTFSVLTFLACLSCLIFLSLETSFSICLGCLLYRWRYKEQAQYCPGEFCNVKSRPEIQKTSGVQLWTLVGLAAYVALVVVVFNDYLSHQPREMFEALEAVLAKR